VGYQRYLELIEDLLASKQVISSGMTKELERCKTALATALQGETVALISSGDAGIYGMAGLALELATTSGMDVPIEIIPGVTSATAAAARLGAPLMLDFAAISLSDLLVPWETIRKRLEAVAVADLVVVLYNPRSRKRKTQLTDAAEIFRNHRPGTSPVGVATSVGTEDERIVVSDLDRFLDAEINMRSLVIVGNSSSKIMGGWFVTPRGYKV